MDGYSDGKFEPDEAITRGEFAKLIAVLENRSYEESRDTIPFSDIEGIWAKNYICEAFDKGLIDGYGNGSFSPDRPVSRVEALKLLNKLFGRDVKDTDYSNLENPEDKAVLDDMDENHWGYYEITEAVNSHVYEKNPESGAEKWLRIENEHNEEEQSR